MAIKWATKKGRQGLSFLISFYKRILWYPTSAVGIFITSGHMTIFRSCQPAPVFGDSSKENEYLNLTV